MLTLEKLIGMTLANCGVLPKPEEVLEWFRLLQAGWVHSGDSVKPHALLHSGKHSNGFFLCKRVLSRGTLREILAYSMIHELYEAGLEEVHGVFGSPYSSILLAGDIARLLGDGVKVYIPEKDPKDPTGKAMIFKGDDPVPEGAVLLQVEELVTTFDSGEAAKQAIIVGNPCPVIFSPLVGVLVHRPPVLNRILPDGRKLVPFIEKQVAAWDPADCPLCKAGSKVVPPKTKWAELTA